MRIQLHHNYEKSLIELADLFRCTPTDYIKRLILEDYNKQFKEATKEAQGYANGCNKV